MSIKKLIHLLQRTRVKKTTKLKRRSTSFPGTSPTRPYEARDHGNEVEQRPVKKRQNDFTLVWLYFPCATRQDGIHKEIK